MAGLRQRRGVMAVGHVDRLEEPKEHVHIHRIVRQGALQGTLSFVGMLLPLLAIRALSLPEHFWSVLPMAVQSAAGPLVALVWRSAALEQRMPGRQRWFIYALRTLLAASGRHPRLAKPTSPPVARGASVVSRALWWFCASPGGCDVSAWMMQQ